MGGQSRARRKDGRKGPPRSQDRGWLLVLLAVTLLIGGGLIIGLLARSDQAAPVPKVRGAPRVEVSQETIDYGDVKVNTPIETIFRVRNVGDQPLQILGEPQVEVVEGC
ncbi:MAG: hypothetical protein RML36_14835 [Anaerolineae bacterium]|nr:DUF1573 domain-containing protein [Anaerolineae bacterium]MDW8100747.1 hypothetical protein [Anaerolineae bacterium]